MYPDNSWYSHRQILLRYCNIFKDFPVFASIQHGHIPIKSRHYRSHNIIMGKRKFTFAPALVWNKKQVNFSMSKGVKNIQTVKARALWFKILDSQMETGTPYILYKDACNIKSNQKNLGTIKSSNLCTEIVEYSSKDETAVCNLASIGLSKFVDNDKHFDYEQLHKVAKVVTYNLNKVIDVNFYPTEKTKRSNMLHRPIGIGVQGLADVFALMDIPFHSESAKDVNKNIFETIYHAALECSNEIAVNRHTLINERLWYIKSKCLLENYSTNDKCDIVYSDSHININLQELRQIYNNEPICGSYSSFSGCPASQGILQFDMWGVSPSDRYDWNESTGAWDKTSRS